MILQTVILFTAISAFLLGGFVYLKNRRHPINRSFGILSSLFGIWILTNLVTGFIKTPFWVRAMYTSGSFTIWSVLAFVSEFCELGIDRFRKIIYWVIALLFSGLTFTKFFIKEIRSVRLGAFEGTFGIGFYIWCIYAVIFMGYGVFIFITTYIKSHGVKRLQIKYITIGFLCTAIFVIIVDAILPILGNNNWMALDTPSSLFYLSFTAYAIIRYRVMEIDTVIHRTILWLATSLWLILPVYAIFRIVQPWLVKLTPFWLTISAAAFFYIFLGYYRYFQPRIDHFFRRRKYDYQTVLGKVAEKIATTIDIEDLSRNLLNEVCETMYLRSSLLYILDREENKYSLIARRGYKEIGGTRQRTELELYTKEERANIPAHMRELNPESSIYKWLTKHQDILEREQVEINPQYEEIKQDSLNWFKEQEIELIVPLIFENNIHAILGLGKKENLQAFTKKDLELLKKLGQEAGVTIFNALHYEDSLEKERLEEEMKMGRQIQMALLPQSLPQVSGLTVQGMMQPAKEIGGDYYDFIGVPNKDNIAIVVGDVSGKGVGAGLIMSMTKATIHTLCREGFSPKEILLRTNQLLNQHIGGQKFMTLLYLVWQSQSKTLTYSSAGHEHILVYRAETRDWVSPRNPISTSRVEAILSGGFMLGMIPDIDKFLEEKQFQLNQGDKILLYSDGVTEAENASRDRFGLERLKEAFNKYGQKPASELMQAIKDEIYNFIGDHPQYDDITLVVMEAT